MLFRVGVSIAASFLKENFYFFTHFIWDVWWYIPNMSNSSCILADMLKDMDYVCSRLCQVCFFKVSSSCISVLLACGFSALCFKTIFAGCRIQDDICSSICAMACWIFRLLGLGNIYLGKWGYRCDNIYVAPFRNLTCDEILACWGHFDTRLVDFSWLSAN